jgi:hypothetical protein
MSTFLRTAVGRALFAGYLALAAVACEQPPEKAPPKAPAKAPAPPADPPVAHAPTSPADAPVGDWPAPPAGVKRTPLGKNLFLEVLPGGQRRVALQADVCLREGALELLLCKQFTKEHEAVLHADIDARQVHAALIVCGAKPGHVVQYEPKFQPPSGSTITVTLQYLKAGQVVSVSGREWVRDQKTKKTLGVDWVFAGSQFFPDPDDPKKPPHYAANGGDVICVSNFDDAMLDLPIDSSKADAELQFEANTPVIPEMGTKVIVLLEVAGEKK